MATEKNIIQHLFELEGKIAVWNDPYLAAMSQEGLEKIDSDQLIGIEVELEKADVPMRVQSALWVAHGDGSLRNGGLEWITHPFMAKNAPAALQDLFSGGADKCCFTPRTSVHVHVNCRNLTKDRVLDTVLLYLFFEKRLYGFVGKNRIKNIYCVPINESGLADGLLTRRFDKVVTGWKKYTGLNLLPLRSKGTIEFRQMHGTSDVRKLSIWIRMITSMFKWSAAKGTNEVRKTLGGLWTEADLEKLGEDVFGEDWKHLSFHRNSRDDIFNAKQAFANMAAIGSLELADFKESPYNLFKRTGA